LGDEGKFAKLGCTPQLSLDVEECPNLVQPKYRQTRETNVLAKLEHKPLFSGRIIEQWDSGCKFLIVGERGAGKSTTIRELARDLIERGDLPIVINLIEWEKYCKRGRTFSFNLFSKWLVQELQKYDIGPEIGEKWVDEYQLVFF
jgi:GTPase SAR1 family protein